MKRAGIDSCTGCHVCALPCPVFRKSRDLTLTLHGRARAVQAGATASDVAPSALACVLCGACEPVCPEEIDTVDVTLELRRALASRNENPLARALATRFSRWIEAPTSAPVVPGTTALTLLASSRFDAEPGLLEATVLALGGRERVTVAGDGGDDLANRLEAGLTIPAQRQRRFADGLPAGRIVVGLEGLLLRQLRRWRPDLHTMALGEALLRRRGVTARLGSDDMLVIDSRDFHAQHTKLVRFYDDLRVQTGCELNLDLQRVAISTGAASLQARLGFDGPDIAGQVDWILSGRQSTRVVVEAVEDLAAFRRHSRLPVRHLAELSYGSSR